MQKIVHRMVYSWNDSFFLKKQFVRIVVALFTSYIFSDIVFDLYVGFIKPKLFQKNSYARRIYFSPFSCFARNVDDIDY